MIPIFANMLAEKGCECWNRTTSQAGRMTRKSVQRFSEKVMRKKA